MKRGTTRQTFSSLLLTALWLPSCHFHCKPYKGFTAPDLGEIGQCFDDLAVHEFYRHTDRPNVVGRLDLSGSWVFVFVPNSSYREF